MSESTSESQAWLCIMCGYVYEPDFGDPTQGIDPGTPFDDLPEDWVCPLCFVEKSEFEPC
jgi:rubredoxin